MTLPDGRPLAWQRPLAEDEGLAFIHIPKTAGTSLQGSLASAFPSEEVCEAQLWPELLAAPPGSLERYRLFAGHFFHLGPLVGRPLRHLTMLRSAVPRAVSQFQHISRDPGHHFHERANEAGSLDRFLDDPELRDHLDNHQTRHILRASIPSDGSRHPWFDTFRLQESELLEMAKDAVADRFDVVGIVERMPASITAIRRTFGLDLPDPDTENTAAARLPLDEPLTRRLEEITQVDAQLHAWASQRLSRQVGEDQ